jgi:hypothetical protein
MPRTDAHPDVDELTLMPTTAGYAPVQDWLDSLVPMQDASCTPPTPADPDWQYAG